MLKLFKTPLLEGPNLNLGQSLQAILSLAFIIIVLDLFLKGGVIFSEALFLDDIQLSQKFANQTSDSTNMGLRFYSLLVSKSADFDIVQVSLLGINALALGLSGLLIYTLSGNLWLSLFTVLAIYFYPTNFILGVFANGSYNSQYLLVMLFAIMVAISAVSSNISKNRLLAVLFASKALLLASITFTASSMLASLSASFLITLFVMIRYGIRSNPFKLILVFDLAIIVSFLIWLFSYDHPYKQMSNRLSFDVGVIFSNYFHLLHRTVEAYVNPFFSTGKPINSSGIFYGVILITVFPVIWVITAFVLKKKYNFVVLSGICFLLMNAALVPLSTSSITHIWHYQTIGFFLVLSAIFLLSVYSEKLSVLAAGALILAGLNQFGAFDTHFSKDAEDQRLLKSFVVSEEKSWSERDEVYMVYENRFPVSGINQPFRTNAYYRAFSNLDNPPALILIRSWEKQRINNIPKDAIYYNWKNDQFTLRE